MAPNPYPYDPSYRNPVKRPRFADGSTVPRLRTEATDRSDRRRRWWLETARLIGQVWAVIGLAVIVASTVGALILGFPLLFGGVYHGAPAYPVLAILAWTWFVIGTTLSTVLVRFMEGRR